MAYWIVNIITVVLTVIVLSFFFRPTSPYAFIVGIIVFFAFRIVVLKIWLNLSKNNDEV